MTLIERREAEKQTFIKKRLKTLYATIKSGNPTEMFVLNFQNARFKQFAISYDKARSEYNIANQSGNGCSFVLGTTFISAYIDVKLYDVKEQFPIKSETDLPFFLYCFMDQFEDMERDYLQMNERFDKLEATANVIRQQIVEIFHSSAYEYHLEETDNKILLSVPLCNRVHLSIPVYYRQYRQILPHVIETVKAYEKVVTGSKIRVFVLGK